MDILKIVFNFFLVFYFSFFLFSQMLPKKWQSAPFPLRHKSSLNIWPSNMKYQMLKGVIFWILFLYSITGQYLQLKFAVSWTSIYRLDSDFMTDASAVCKLDASSSVSLKSVCESRGRSERSHIIMRNFARVIWNVLKQYNSKMKVLFSETNH